jgi:hypothetical protein
VFQITSNYSHSCSSVWTALMFFTFLLAPGNVFETPWANAMKQSIIIPDGGNLLSEKAKDHPDIPKPGRLTQRVKQD